MKLNRIANNAAGDEESVKTVTHVFTTWFIPLAICLDNIGHRMKSVHHSYVYSHLCLIVALHFNSIVLKTAGASEMCCFSFVSLSRNHSFWLYGRHFASFHDGFLCSMCDCMCCHVLIFKSTRWNATMCKSRGADKTKRKPHWLARVIWKIKTRNHKHW